MSEHLIKEGESKGIPFIPIPAKTSPEDWKEDDQEIREALRKEGLPEEEIRKQIFDVNPETTFREAKREIKNQIKDGVIYKSRYQDDGLSG